MESLLALAFDNLSSYDGPKVKKGLKQVEGVLAQLCLSSKDPAKSPRKSISKSPGDMDEIAESLPTNKTLDDLADDPAFREFFKTQEGFQYNIATHLLDTLERLVARGGDGQYDLLIASVMDLLQGILLLHPPSKKLFAREQNMNLLLDLIEPVNCPSVQSATLLTLMIALIDAPDNVRSFEGLDGLLAVTSLFKSRGTSRAVRAKLAEVLYVYLMPETPSIPSAGARDSVSGLLQRSPSKLAGAFSTDTSGRKRADSNASNTATTEEKVELLSRYMSNVDEFVRDLKAYAPFEGVTL